VVVGQFEVVEVPPNERDAVLAILGAARAGLVIILDMH
jgi:hypothetical protein